MHRIFILLLVVLMPFKALAAAYGVCSQDASVHGQSHQLQASQSHHENASLQSDLGTQQECTHCNLCHTTCGTFVMPLANGLPNSNAVSQVVLAHVDVSLKNIPSEPPYRPKWRALA